MIEYPVIHPIDHGTYYIIGADVAQPSQFLAERLRSAAFSLKNLGFFAAVWTSSGWWLTYPPEKYEFVNRDDDIPNMWEKNVPNHQPVLGRQRLWAFLVGDTGAYRTSEPGGLLTSGAHG